jgi:hypothetical protein
MGLMITISIMHVMFESCHILWKHILCIIYMIENMDTQMYTNHFIIHIFNNIYNIV